MYTSIRPWKLSDSADLAEGLNNPHILAKLRDGLPFPYTERDARAYIEDILAADPQRCFTFAITLDGLWAGSISVTRGENVYRLTGELGYYVAEPYWGRGLATLAAVEICNYVFSNSDIVRIYAEPFAFNTASCRVLEKAGFTCEATLRSSAVKGGKICDTKLYSLLREELQASIDRT